MQKEDLEREHTEWKIRENESQEVVKQEDPAMETRYLDYQRLMN